MSEHRLRRRDGDYCWVSCRGLVVRDESGKPLRMAGSMSDVTERKQAEQRLFLSFMESCSICFRIDDTNSNDPEYLAPALLPQRDHFARQCDLWRQLALATERCWFTYEHAFLHLGVMQRFTTAVGRKRLRILHTPDGVRSAPAAGKSKERC